MTNDTDPKKISDLPEVISSTEDIVIDPVERDSEETPPTEESCQHECHTDQDAIFDGDECCDNPAKKKKFKLTMKQRIWLREYMEDGNQTRAALVAYYPEFQIKEKFSEYSEEEKKTYDAAAQIGYENLRKLQMPLDELMDEAGLTNVYLTRKMREQLEATSIQGPMGVEHMDGKARNKALEIAMKSKKLLTDRVDHTSGGQKIAAPLILSDIPARPKEE